MGFVATLKKGYSKAAEMHKKFTAAQAKRRVAQTKTMGEKTKLLKARVAMEKQRAALAELQRRRTQAAMGSMGGGFGGPMGGGFAAPQQRKPAQKKRLPKRVEFY